MEDQVQITALKKRGWSIAAISRHVGRDPKTIRSYLNKTAAGIDPSIRAKPPGYESPFERFKPYLTQRFADDPHVMAVSLYEEVGKLGYSQSYPSFTRHLRENELRPKCASCVGVKSRLTTEIVHPPGEEIQFDFLELPSSLLGPKSHILIGTLSFSSRSRGVFASSESRPSFIKAIEGVLYRLGGTARRWRFDNLPAIKGTYGERIAREIFEMAKYYGAEVVLCPPYTPWRKGAVEKFNDYLAQRWWRTAKLTTVSAAQKDLDRFSMEVADMRRRPPARLASAGVTPEIDSRGRFRYPLVKELAELENLKALPDRPYPYVVETKRVVTSAALVSYEGNFYSVEPSVAHRSVTLEHHLSRGSLTITSNEGLILGSHLLQPAGMGLIQRDPKHLAALEEAVLKKAAPTRPHKRKANVPASEASESLAKSLRRDHAMGIDLKRYEELVTGGRR